MPTFTIFVFILLAALMEPINGTLTPEEKTEYSKAAAQLLEGITKSSDTQNTIKPHQMSELAARLLYPTTNHAGHVNKAVSQMGEKFKNYKSLDEELLLNIIAEKALEQASKYMKSLPKDTDKTDLEEELVEMEAIQKIKLKKIVDNLEIGKMYINFAKYKAAH